MRDLVDIVGVSVPVHGHLQLCFSDGASARLDLAKRLRPVGLFAKVLLDPDLFARATIDTERSVVVWPNGADLDRDQLRAWADGLDPPTWVTLAP